MSEPMCELCETSRPIAGCRFCDPCDEVRRKMFAGLARSCCRRLIDQAMTTTQGHASDTVRYGGGRMIITVELVERLDT